MEDILKRLETTFVGRRLLYYDTLPSTMDAARALARQGTEEGTVVIAGMQTRGRGRLERPWVSPDGTLALSAVFYPALEQLPQIVMMSALAAVKAIRDVAGIEAVIKWPNDVLIGGKKVCGILIESEFKGARPSFVIIGIGLNINVDTGAYPDIAAIATSLSRETGRRVSYPTVVASLLGALEEIYLRIRSGQPVAREWREGLETLGKKVRVRSGNVVEEGVAESVTDSGDLLLRRSDGSLATILVGDVTVLKG